MSSPAKSPPTASPAQGQSPSATGAAATGAAAAQVEVDEQATGPITDDADSALDQALSTYTASLTSSVVDYPYEHGRRYHAFRSGSYILPNDEQEIDRLDVMHVLMTKITGDVLQMAPIDTAKPLRVLDIGTGTGVWATELADENPNFTVLGNDLSPIQSHWLPPNLKFEVDDVESPWMHEQPFDYIFCRYMTCCILDWPKLVGNIYDALTPGAWVEFQDFDLQYRSDDGSLKEDSYIMQWINTLMGAADKIGRDPAPGRSLERWAKDAGFENVTHHMYKAPVGPWAKDARLKDIGYCNLAQILDGLEAFSLRLFCGILKWQEEEVMVLLANVRRELKTPGIHAYVNYHVAYGQKPMA